MKEFLIEIFRLIGTLPLLAKTLIVVLIIVSIGGYFYVKALWEHEENALEIMNKYASEKRSLEITKDNLQQELENCKGE